MFRAAPAADASGVKNGVAGRAVQVVAGLVHGIHFGGDAVGERVELIEIAGNEHVAGMDETADGAAGHRAGHRRAAAEQPGEAIRRRRGDVERVAVGADYERMAVGEGHVDAAVGPGNRADVNEARQRLERLAELVLQLQPTGRATSHRAERLVQSRNPRRQLVHLRHAVAHAGIGIAPGLIQAVRHVLETARQVHAL